MGPEQMRDRGSRRMRAWSGSVATPGRGCCNRPPAGRWDIVEAGALLRAAHSLGGDGADLAGSA
jgi:hypothetical protein